MTKEDKKLFNRAKSRVRSMRNQGIYSQKDYEIGVKIIRELIKHKQFDAPVFEPM